MNTNKRYRNALAISVFGLIALPPLAPLAAADKSAAPAEMKQAKPPMYKRPDLGAIIAGPAPANVTLTPASPTNIQIAWAPVGGAVRYVISRNGAPDTPIDANAGYLQGNRFLYTDIGRRPATLHTYSVTAQFPAPTLPGRSAPMQLLTPSASPPQNFRASVSGPNAVTLSWSARPEAAGYRLIRNGGNMPATVLDAPGPHYVDQNLPVGEYTYAVFSVVRLASGEELQGELSKPATVRTRPFNMLAIGDSVMWGQGLQPANKFTTKVSVWIEGQLGKAVDLRMRAHSGAITYPESGKPVYENRSYDGEVPAHWPTISRQISLAGSPSVPGQPAARDVDLVLIDGCANNLGITTVLNPFLSDEELRSDTRAYCGAGMTNVLNAVVRTFPNADVIVTGYFPYVSSQSDLRALIPVFSLISTLSSAVPVAGVLVPPDPLIGGIAATAGYRERAAARSDLFFKESNSSLQAAVDTVNTTPFPGRTKSSQIRFARLNAGPNNSYASPDTWQFLIPTPPFVQDDVYNARKVKCDEVLLAAGGNPDLMPGAHPLCLQASMGHPNAAGAQAYTDAIKSAATQFMPQWRTAHVGPVTAREDSVVVRIQPGPYEPSGGTMVVTASDGVSGPALQGTVQLNGVPAGALGAPIRYAYQQHGPTDITAGVHVPGRQPRYFAIPVRAFSVAVNLTNNGDPRTALVTATDSATGQLLAGTVTVNSNVPVSGSTGQPLTYPSCGSAAPSFRLMTSPGTASPLPCLGTVRVPFYPDVAYQDVPGPVATVRMQPPPGPSLLNGVGVRGSSSPSPRHQRAPRAASPARTSCDSAPYRAVLP